MILRIVAGEVGGPSGVISESDAAQVPWSEGTWVFAFENITLTASGEGNIFK